jgi:hypothetical protein
MESGWTVRDLRTAIWKHQVSFPSQVPVFKHLHRVDIQWRVVLLYFVRGWSGRAIGARYGVSNKRVVQLLRQWTSRAIILGYVDRIPTEAECLHSLDAARNGAHCAVANSD